MGDQCVIEQRLNPLTGDAEWVVIRETILGNEEKRGGGSLAHTQYLDMLNDGPRNRAYDEAIRKVVNAGDHVLDIGAGTGLLSMMAYRAMNAATAPARDVNCLSKTVPSTDDDDDDSGISATPGPATTGKITACESYLPMVRLARKLLRVNVMDHGVRLIHKRSDELKIGIDLPAAADVLVSEILDSGLLGEGLIPTLRHAHAHLVKPNARTVPHRATVFGQLVECNYLWRCQDLAGVEADIGDGLLLAPTKSKEATCGSFGTMHIDALADKLNLISKPFKVFEFEMSKMPADHRVCELEIPIAKAGSVHALVSWWVLQLDEDGEIMYSTAPEWIQRKGDGSSWRDHWKQCIWYFPGRGVTVFPGDRLRVAAIHDEISIRYLMRLPSKVESPQLGPREGGPFIGQGDRGYDFNLVLRPERVGFLGDKRYRQIIKEAVMKAVQEKSSPLCLIVDDSLLCTVTAALLQPHVQVVAMLPGLKREGSNYIKSITEANALNFDRLQIVSKKAAHLSADDLKGRKVEVLIAEPYYKAYEDLLPWRHLRFWYERTSLAPLLVDHPTIIPCEGILRGVAVFLPDLWNSRKGLTSVEGFEHSQVNRVLGACGGLSSLLEGPLLPYSLWQCGRCKELTDPFSILTFDFSLGLQAVKGSVTASVSSSGLCHGIALWIDWVMEKENNLIISGGPSGGEPNYWKQGVKLLSSPLQLFHSSGEDIGATEESSRSQNHSLELVISAVFSPSTGDIEVDVTTNPC